MIDHDSLAFKLLEALDPMPLNNEDALEIVQRFLDKAYEMGEERTQERLDDQD